MLQMLHRDHQKVLFCAGLSGAAEECQQRISSFSSFSDNRSDGAHSEAQQQQQQQAVAAQEALRVLAAGMERAVVSGRGRSVESIEAQGLSVADVFYAEVGGRGVCT